jgi:hypothetical protein
MTRKHPFGNVRASGPGFPDRKYPLTTGEEYNSEQPLFVGYVHECVDGNTGDPTPLPV